MTYKLFGAKSSVLTYSDLATAFTAAPNFPAAGPVPAFNHYSDQLSRLRGLAEVVEAVAADAEATAVPPALDSLQELVQAGRARLYRERSRSEREDLQEALVHLTAVRERLKP
jgi:hypothetical protein